MSNYQTGRSGSGEGSSGPSFSTGDYGIELDARADFTITLASLASGAGRKSANVANANKRHAALVAVQIQPGTAPNDGTIYTVYLLRSNGDIADDDVGAGDAAYTPRNAAILGTVRNNNTTSVLKAIFDTAPLGPLGDTWAIAIVNETNQALSASGSKAQYQYYRQRITFA